MNQNLNQLANVVFKANKLKGFHDKPQETGTYLMLMVSELGEALEADRKGIVTSVDLNEIMELPDDDFAQYFKTYVKDSHEDEIADTLIRILDYCGLRRIPIQEHVEAKLRYNATRPHKHGKAY